MKQLLVILFLIIYIYKGFFDLLTLHNWKRHLQLNQNIYLNKWIVILLFLKLYCQFVFSLFIDLFSQNVVANWNMFGTLKRSNFHIDANTRIKEIYRWYYKSKASYLELTKKLLLTPGWSTSWTAAAIIAAKISKSLKTP